METLIGYVNYSHLPTKGVKFTAFENTTSATINAIFYTFFVNIGQQFFSLLLLLMQNSI